MVASAFVDLAFQIVLEGEEEGGGPADEERVWEGENLDEVNSPPCPPQACICRQFQVRLEGIAESGILSKSWEVRPEQTSE
jgi:hypothetical protein